MFDFFKKRKQEKFQNHKNAAINAYNNSDKNRAVQELEIALKIKPDCYETWCQLGEWCFLIASEKLMINKDKKEFTMLLLKAEQAVKKSIEINPQYALGYYTLAKISWGSDFRKALIEYEKAAKLDKQYLTDVEEAKKVVAEFTHKFGKLKIIHLNSLEEKPLPQIYETEFYFQNTPIGCVVMHTCISGSKRQSTHSWIFRSENPDLYKEYPIGEVHITSKSDVSITQGCPVNYGSLLMYFRRNNLL